MIITRTPVRISLLGGGTDYPDWYRANGGAVLGTAIDKYCYITSRWLPPFFDHKFRIVYSETELVDKVRDIKHPSVRECLRYLKIRRGVEVHHAADLPARTGLGSSSSFTVGLLHTLYVLKGMMPSKRQLALDAIHIEQTMIRENVGSQDQTFAAFGGLNVIEFGGESGIHLQPLTLSARRARAIQDHLMLFFTGFSRSASAIAAEQIKEIPNKNRELVLMHEMVGEGARILTDGTDLMEFGRLLHEGWQIKRTLSTRIATAETDAIYEAALGAGAAGGKLLGAGGGGFMLIFARPSVQTKIRERLKELLLVPFNFESSGSQVILCER